MRYEIEFRRQAIKDLDDLPADDRRRVLEKAQGLREDLAGDVKHLTSFTPEWRLRVGRYRVLFEVEGVKVVIYRVKHRRESYR